MHNARQNRLPTESVTVAPLPLHFDKRRYMLLSKYEGNACRHGSNCRKELSTC
jgi:hypothetical protein